MSAAPLQPGKAGATARRPAANSDSGVTYRFPAWKDANWNSLERHRERYEAIRRHLPESGGVGAELGVYKGGFGEFLLPHCSKLYLVDTWYRSGGFWHSGIAGDSRVDTLIDILTIYKAEIESGQVEIVVEYAEHFLNSMSDEAFDFLYLDSSHGYDQTVLELAAARPKLKAGGILLGDDFDPDPTSNQHGVYVAVMEFIERHAGELVLSKGRQWGVRLRS